jgi:hypothetical protein
LRELARGEGRVCDDQVGVGEEAEVLPAEAEEDRWQALINVAPDPAE